MGCTIALVYILNAIVLIREMLTRCQFETATAVHTEYMPQIPNRSLPTPCLSPDPQFIEGSGNCISLGGVDLCSAYVCVYV